MKTKRNRTREKVIRKVRQLAIAEEAFCNVASRLIYGSHEHTLHQAFLTGFRWAVFKIKEIA